MRIPPNEREPNNPRGYVEEPDRHPRADLTPQEELGQLQRLRQALPLLSVGVQQLVSAGPIGQSLGGFRHSSPEPRVVRVSFPGVTDAERIANTGIQVTIAVVEGVDSRGHKRRIEVPQQGLAFATPAGNLTAEILRGQGQTAAADNEVNVSVSAGFLSTRWYSDPNASFVNVPAFPATVAVAAPTFATALRAFVLSGTLSDPFGVGPLVGVGATATVALSGNGVAIFAGFGGPAAVLLSWEITE